MKRLFIFFGILSFALAQAQTENLNLKPEREGFALKVSFNQNQSYIQEIPKSSYFAEEKTLQIYPGENVALEVEMEKDNIVSLTSVNENRKPEKTLEIEFCEVVENNITKSALLYIRNPFEKKLKFTTLVYDINHSEWKTETHEIKAKETSVEKWEIVLGSIVIRDWKLE